MRIATPVSVEQMLQISSEIPVPLSATENVTPSVTALAVMVTTDPAGLNLIALPTGEEHPQHPLRVKSQRLDWFGEDDQANARRIGKRCIMRTTSR